MFLHGGDFARLTWANVDLTRGELRLVTAKTGRRMCLPLAAPLRRHLESLPAGDVPETPLHPRAFAVVTREGRSGPLSNQFGDLLAQAGFRAKKDHQKSSGGVGRTGPKVGNALSFHSLRRTAITLLHEAGMAGNITGGIDMVTGERRGVSAEFKRSMQGIAAGGLITRGLNDGPMQIGGIKPPDTGGGNDVAKGRTLIDAARATVDAIDISNRYLENISRQMDVMGLA